VATDTAGADLARHGIRAGRTVHRNLGPAVLVEHAVRRGEGVLTEGGAFVGPHRTAHGPVAG
jgi:ATP-dependent phosphoenolpyruvate carboxykinase